MGRPKPATQQVEVPLGTLGQKEAPQWLQIGQAQTVDNLVKNKSSTLQKTLGLASLSTSNASGQTLSTAKRLATQGATLLTVGPDTVYQDGLWAFEETAQQQTLLDRVPEVYIPAPVPIATFEESIWDMDRATAGGYTLHVFLVDLTFSGVNSGLPFYAVTDATTGQVVVPPQQIVAAGLVNTPCIAPKLTLSGGGPLVILTLQVGSFGQIWGLAFDLGLPLLPWSGAVQMTGVIGAPSRVNAIDGVYGVNAVDDDLNTLIVIYPSTNGASGPGTAVVNVVTYTASGGLSPVAAGTFTDAAAITPLTGCCIRASNADGNAWLAYAYQVTALTAAVTGGALVYPALSSVTCSAVDLTRGVFNAYAGPYVMDIKEAGTVIGAGLIPHPQTQHVVWSPPLVPFGNTVATQPVVIGQNAYNVASGTNATPSCAIYRCEFYAAAGTGTVHQNWPRWTNGASLASTMAIMQPVPNGAKAAYMCAWMPSYDNVPGSGAVQSVVINQGGQLYAFNQVAYVPVVTATGGGGSGFQGTAVVDTTLGPTYGEVLSVTIINGGSGYTSAPTLKFTFGTGAVFVPVVVSGMVTKVTLTSGGSGYNTTPQTIPLYAVEPSGATGFFGWAIVNSSGVMTGVDVVSAGSGYTAPTIVYGSSAANGQQGFGATATAVLPTVTRQNIQGTFWLMCEDNWADATSPNSEAPPFATNCPLRLVGSLKPRLGNNRVFASCHTLPHLVQNTSAGSLVYETDLPISVSPSAVAPTAFSFDFRSQVQHQFAELGGLTGFASGTPHLTDGSKDVQFASPYYPENLVITTLANTPTIGGLSPGTRQYLAIYERRDFAGNVHPSGRSVPQTVVLAPGTATYTVTLAVPTMGYSLGQKATNTKNLSGLSPQPVETIQVFRTTDGGDIFYNISSLAQGSPQVSIGLNALGPAYVVIGDGLTDVDLQVNAQCYGDGSDGSQPGDIVDNLTPPSFQAMCVHKGRFWGVDGVNLWYTKAFTAGEGPGFNEVFAFSVDDGSSPITAIVPMDERLIIFKRDRIFYLTGDGPDDNQANNDLQPPQRIQSDVGAIDWRGCVPSPTGIWFNSDNGIYQLTRKLEVQPAGKFVEDVLAQYPTVTSAVLDMRNGVVVFSAVNTAAELPNGTLIIYSWVLDAWTTETLDVAIPGPAPASLPVYTATLSRPTPGGAAIYNCASSPRLGAPLLLRQTNGVGAGSYYVSGNYQTGTFESPWIRGADLDDFHHFWMVHAIWQSLDPHAMTVQIAYNYSNTYTDTWTVGATSQAAITTPLIQWDFQPNQGGNVEAIRIKFTDAADATIPPVSGQGPLYISLKVEYGTQEGSYPVPVVQRGSAP